VEPVMKKKNFLCPKDISEDFADLWVWLKTQMLWFFPFGLLLLNLYFTTMSFHIGQLGILVKKKQFPNFAASLFE
jgi:hypothetical protein